MKHSVARLKDVAAGLPSIDESAACAQKLKAAMFDGITEKDKATIMGKLKDKALSGDLKATELLLKVIGQAAPTPTYSVGVRVNQDGRQPGENGVAPARIVGHLPSGMHTLRSACARLLTGGPLGSADLEAGQDDYLAEEIDAALADCAWFEREGQRWALTDKGRKDLFARKEA